MDALDLQVVVVVAVAVVVAKNAEQKMHEDPNHIFMSPRKGLVSEGCEFACERSPIDNGEFVLPSKDMCCCLCLCQVLNFATWLGSLSST